MTQSIYPNKKSIVSEKSEFEKQLDKSIGQAMFDKSVLLITIKRKPNFGILFRLESFWIGLHYSKACKRYCLNLLPCITIWWCKKDGFPVDLKRM